MDRRETIELSGSDSYYMPRGMGGSIGNRTLTNPSVQYQHNFGISSIGSRIPIESSSIVQPHHGVNLSVRVAVPPGEPVKRKRGRPRKYGHNTNVSLALSPSSSTPAVKLTPTHKRGRGRPPGSGQKLQLPSLGGWLSGTAGMGFTPHVITIAVGEDITTKIMSFSQQGPRAICILSANGAISTVTLHQPSTSGGTVTYEGRFEILCLSGSYLVTGNGGPCARTGSLSVSLASADGRVIGGGVGGSLIAASPVQVIVGSFVCGSSKTKNKAGEIQGGGGDLDGQRVDNAVTQASLQTNQSFNPPSSVGVWTDARSVDVHNAHVDIDLMRE